VKVYSDTDVDMDKFVIYWSNSNGTSGSEIIHYAYDVVITNAKGEQTTISQNDAKGTNSLDTSKDVIVIPEGFENVKSIEIRNITARNTKGAVYSTAILRGFKWVARNSTEEKVCSAYSNSQLKVVQNTADDGTITYDIKDGNKTIITGLTTDPSSESFYKDKSSYEASRSSDDANSRIKVYEELDEKYMDYIYESYVTSYKLSSPQNMALNTDASNYHFTWDAVDDAYAYEVKYVVLDDEDDEDSEAFEGSSWYEKDEDGKYVETGTYIVQGRTFFEMPANSDWSGKKIKFYVRAINGQYMKDREDDKLVSDWSSIVVDAIIPLPSPEYHIEMVDNECFMAILDNQEDYIISKDDETGQIEYMPCQIDVYFNSLTHLTIDPAVGYSSNAYAKSDYNSEGNVNVHGIAKPTNATASTGVSYVVSQDVRYYSKIYTNTFFSNASKVLYNTVFYGLYGDTSDSLYYNAGLKYSGAYTIGIGSAIGTYDDELGAYVYCSSGENFLSSSTEIHSILSGLPEDIGDASSIQVITYPWYFEMSCGNYGHTVASDLTREQLIELVDTERFNITVPSSHKNAKVNEKYSQNVFDTETVTEDGVTKTVYKLNDGYMVFKDGDDSYRVVFSNLLEAKQKNTLTKTHILAKTYVRDGDKFYDEDNMSTVAFTVLPKPVIEPGYIESDDGYSYTFTWDVDQAGGALYSDAKYNLELVGYTRDSYDAATGEYNENEGVVLSTVSGVKDNTYTFTDTTKTWNYSQLVLKVVRVGETDSNGKTTSLYNQAEEKFAVSLRLSQPSFPTLELTRDSENNVNKDEVKYSISWTGINNTPAYADEYAGLGGYLITVSTSDENAESGVSSKYFYTVDENSVPADKTIAEYVLSDSGQNLAKAIKAADASEALNNVTILGAYSTALKTELDLSDYTAGTVLSITVTAIARDNQNVYKNSLASAAQTMAIPSRSTAPSPELISIDTPEYSEDTSITESDFSKAKTITYRNDAETQSEGKYQIAMAIFADDSLKDAATSMSGDAANADDTGYWNSGAVITLLGKESGSMMSGTMKLSTLKYSNSSIRWSDYAGMWLKITIRSTSNSNISSRWSDEEKAGGSKWIRLPKVILETPGEAESADGNFSAATQTLTGDVDLFYDEANDCLTYEETETKSFSLRTLSYAPVDYADAYIIRFADKNTTVTDGEIIEPETDETTDTGATEAGTNDSGTNDTGIIDTGATESAGTEAGEIQTPTDSSSETAEPLEKIYTICIQKNEDNTELYDVFVAPEENDNEEDGSEDAIELEALEDVPVCRVPGYEDYVYAGSIAEGGEKLELEGYTGNLDDMPNLPSVYRGKLLNAALEMKSGSFVITLPDVTGKYVDGELETSYPNYICYNTNAVEIQAVNTDSDMLSRYANSRYGIWYRGEKELEVFKVK
jgi:hypothetical protein